MKLVWTRRALFELDAIFAYVARDSRAAAARLTGEIERRAAILAAHPEIGRPGSVDEIRELVLGGTPYILPYRVRDGRVEILAVLHSAQQRPESF